MGDYSVPESIRKYKPKGTMVKKVNGHYYVYEFKTITDANGKRHTKTGPEIGKIEEGIGFVPREKTLQNSEITDLDYGDYAVTFSNSQKTLALLKDYFNPLDATTIYVVAMIHFIWGFTYMRDIETHFEQSYLSIKYPTLKLGYDALASLYDNLGRKQTQVLACEERLIAESSRQVAIDGHVIGSRSEDNELSEEGYRYQKLKEPQINLLMVYDINNGIPLISRIYEGDSPDKISVQDIFDQFELKNMLFVVDRGFYSEDNLSLFTSNDNFYIVPLSKNLTACKKAVSDLDLPNTFIYHHGKKAVSIAYKDEQIKERRVITYRNMAMWLDENTKFQENMEAGVEGYTQEKYNRLKDYFGIIVLQTNLTEETPKQVYELYKKRWSIETYYNYFKNKQDFSELCQQNYYKTQGLSFIMLVSALIHREFSNAVKNTKGKTAVQCLFEAAMVKVHKRHGVWSVSNFTPKHQILFHELNTETKIF